MTKHESIKATIREYVRRVDLSHTPVSKAFRDCYPDAVQEGEFDQAWRDVMNERSNPLPPAIPVEVEQNAAVEVEPILEKPPTAFAKTIVDEAYAAPFKPKLKRGG